MLRVWVDDWQMQCCGDPFAVGDVVRWTLLDRPRTEELTDRTGRREVLRLSHAEDHHADAPEHAPTTAGRVRRVRAVTFAYAPVPGRPDTLDQVAGSGRSHQRTRVDGWEPELAQDPVRRFAGYVVDLEVPIEAPAP